MLRLYARCLKKLNRKDECVRTLLDLLAKSAASLKGSRTGSSAPETGPEGGNKLQNWLHDDQVDTTGIFSELVEYSEHLPYDLTVPMDNYFSDIAVQQFVHHYDDKDGFQLRLQVRHVLEDDITVGKAKVQLTSATSAQSKDIWLESSDPVELKKGVARIWLGSNVRKWA